MKLHVISRHPRETFLWADVADDELRVNERAT